MYWFNTPYSVNVATNIAREFLNIVDICFPKDHPLRSICNRNTMKVSYRTMPNLSQIISRHNTKILDKIETVDNPLAGCNCRAKNSCPLIGQRQTEGVIYKATVTILEEPNNKQTYTGLTGGPFKTRFNSHMASFRNFKKKTETEHSNFIWKLKESSKEYSVSWTILARGTGFNIATKSCRL